jgi:hypothetical protein
MIMTITTTKITTLLKMIINFNDNYTDENGCDDFCYSCSKLDLRQAQERLLQAQQAASVPSDTTCPPPSYDVLHATPGSPFLQQVQ